MATLKEITAQLAQFIADVRGYSQSQIELWQQIPWLALQADGRDGYNSSFNLAYTAGLWCLRHDNAGHVMLDCATGEIVEIYEFGYSGKLPKFRTASDVRVLHAASVLDCFNAEIVVARLKREAAKPFAPWVNETHQNWWAAEQKRLIRMYALKQQYARLPASQVV